PHVIVGMRAAGRRHAAMFIGKAIMIGVERAGRDRHRLFADIRQFHVDFVEQWGCRAAMVRGGQEGAQGALVWSFGTVHFLRDIGVARNRMRAKTVILANDRQALRDSSDRWSEAL